MIRNPLGEKLFADENVFHSLESLIVVPGHAIYLGKAAGEAKLSRCWAGTFPGYLNDDEARLYTEHVEAGVRLAAQDAKSLLVFSGGQTREEVGPVSEAYGYWSLADQNVWFGQSSVKQRAFTEEFARDSFENVLFSLHRFSQCTGTWPLRVSVVGFLFKGQRFTEHATLIQQNPVRFGVGSPFQFHYQSVNDPPYYVLCGTKGSLRRETTTRGQFATDINHQVLSEKRRERDPFMRGNP